MLATAWLLHRLLERPIAGYLRRNLTLRKQTPQVQRPSLLEQRHPSDDRTSLSVLADRRP
jgi:peptidoglycan/LPS O-acetylase OafA/YrhL